MGNVTVRSGYMLSKEQDIDLAKGKIVLSSDHSDHIDHLTACRSRLTEHETLHLERQFSA